MLDRSKPIIIGIAGASGAGKSKFASTIKEGITGLDVSLIHEDNYYKDQANLSMEERRRTNYDHPDAFDHQLLAQHLDLLHEGKAVEMPKYDYKTHMRLEKTRTLKPARIYILEGILVFADPEIRKRLDIKIFVDVALDLCLLRRVQRDILERGSDIKSVVERYLSTVRPMFIEFVEPSKKYADVIIPHGGENLIAVEMLTSQIKQLLGSCGTN